MKVECIGIAGRKRNALAAKTAIEAVAILKEKNIAVQIERGFLKIGGERCIPVKKFSCDIVLSFGGDGTLLQACRDIGKKIPVMGINCGNIGFLQSYKAQEIAGAIGDISAGKFEIEKRTRILARIDSKSAGEALNEVLVVPAKAGRLLRYKLKIGGEGRTEAGDGLIVATPTGSSAHALSAGGPVVKGNAAVFVVVSVNPVDWKHRPLVINDHEKVAISDFEKGIRAELIIDGQKRFGIRKKVVLLKGSEVLFARRKEFHKTG